MKSKISCFNKTIFKKNFTHFWPIWGIYLIYMIFALPVNLWQNMSIEYSTDAYTQVSRQLRALSSVLSFAIKPWPIFLMAAVAVMAVFSYLYTAKNANMFHAFPVNRLELFVTNFLSSFLFIVIPNIIAFVVSVFVSIACGITSIEYLFYWLLCSIGVAFFAVAMAVFIAMFTGQLLAMPIYYFICNYLYVGCLYLMNGLVSTICYGVTSRWNPGKSTMLSPLYYLSSNLRCKAIYNEVTNLTTDIELQGGMYVLIYAGIGVVLLILAYQLYKRRQIETAGDLVSIRFIKPVFRWGVAFCGGFLLSEMFLDIFCYSYLIREAFVWCFIGVIVTGFICFFGAEMLMQKNFRVFQKKRVLEWAAFAVFSACFLGAFKIDAFGIERKVPDADEVASAYISMDYPLVFTGEEINDVIEIHEQFIQHKEEYLDYLDAYQDCLKSGDEEMIACIDYNYVTIRYVLKDGEIFERNYPAPISEEYRENTDVTSPAGWIIAKEQEADNLKKYLFGKYYEENEYYSGSIELFNSKGEYDSYRFTGEELDAIVDAAMQDIEDGNYAKYQIYSMRIGDTDVNTDDEYYNCISLSYYNEKGVVNESDNFYYSYYEEEYYYDGIMVDEIYYDESVESESGYAYLSFGKDCTNLVRTIENMGILNDEWRLYTYDEYDELMGW